MQACGIENYAGIAFKRILSQSYFWIRAFEAFQSCYGSWKQYVPSCCARMSKQPGRPATISVSETKTQRTRRSPPRLRCTENPSLQARFTQHTWPHKSEPVGLVVGSPIVALFSVAALQFSAKFEHHAIVFSHSETFFECTAVSLTADKTRPNRHIEGVNWTLF